MPGPSPRLPLRHLGRAALGLGVLAAHLVAAQQLTVRVQDLTGAAIPGASLVLTPVGGLQPAHTALAGADGTLTLGLAPGTYIASSIAPGFQRASRELTISSGSPAAESIVLLPVANDLCTLCLVLPEPIPLLPSPQLTARLPEPHRTRARHRHRLPAVDPADLDPLSRI